MKTSRDFAISKELDLFTGPPVNVSSLKSFYTEITPINTLDNNAPIQFAIPDVESEFIDLNDSFIYVKGYITADGTKPLAAVATDTITNPAIPNKAKIFPVNYFIGALFKEVNVQFNGKKLTDTNQLYHYKSYIENLTGYDDGSKSESGALGLYFKDSIGLFEEVVLSKNEGAKKRFEMSKYGKSFEAAGRLHNDLFSQSKWLPGDLSIIVTLFVNDPQLYLMAHSDAGKNLKFNFEKCRLFIKRYEITEKIRRSISDKRKKNEIITVPTKRGVLRYKMVPGSLPSFSEKIVHNNEIPKRVIVGMVDSKAFSGDFQANPYNFKHLKIEKITLYKGSDISPFLVLDDLDFENNIFMKAYMSLLKGTGRLFQNDSMALTPKEYAQGQTFFVFDLTKNGIESNMFEIGENANITISITLKDAPTDAFVVLFYLEYDSMIAIGSETSYITGDIKIE